MCLMFLFQLVDHSMKFSFNIKLNRLLLLGFDSLLTLTVILQLLSVLQVQLLNSNGRRLKSFWFF